jgi:hypothetical protein
MKHRRILIGLLLVGFGFGLGTFFSPTTAAQAQNTSCSVSHEWGKIVAGVGGTLAFEGSDGVIRIVNPVTCKATNTIRRP